MLRFQPGHEARRFVAVPGGATWAELRIRAGELDTPKVGGLEDFGDFEDAWLAGWAELEGSRDAAC